MKLLDGLHHNYYRVSCFLGSCHTLREREVSKTYKEDGL